MFFHCLPLMYVVRTCMPLLWGGGGGGACFACERVHQCHRADLVGRPENEAVEMHTKHLHK